MILYNSVNILNEYSTREMFGNRKIMSPIINNIYFNKPVIIGNKINSCDFMFANCSSFNQPVTIPTGVTNCSNMFNNCKRFNQPVTIPTGVIDCNNMFRDCSNFNQSITFMGGVRTCVNMFNNCINFNYPISFPPTLSIDSCYCMFANSGFNQDITIGPLMSSNLQFMFTNCNNFAKNIYFNAKSVSILNVYGILFSTNNYKRKNLYFNQSVNELFNKTDSDYSVVAKDIGWTPMTNGFYNTAFNVYCYYNYVP